MLSKLPEEYHKCGLTINTNNTEYIVVRNPRRDILLERGVAEGADAYKYIELSLIHI